MPSTETAKLIASAVMRRGDKVLVFEEENDSGVMKYNLPGGHVEPGETPIDALIREVAEETGFDARPQSFLQLVVNTWSKNHSVLMCFLVAAGDAEVRPEPGVTARWMTASEVAALQDDQCVFGIKDAIRKAFAGEALAPGTILVRKAGERIEWERPE